MNTVLSEQTQSISLPVNFNGVLNVTLPAHVNVEEFCAMALAQFQQLLQAETSMGETGKPPSRLRVMFGALRAKPRLAI